MLWLVPLETETDRTYYVVDGFTPNDARYVAAMLFERYHNLDAARWDAGKCGRWIRHGMLKADTPHDGVLCAIGKPEPFTIK